VGIGSYNLSYSFTDGFGCTNTANVTVGVTSNLTVLPGADFAVCVDAGIVALTGATPSGGTWTGTGVTGFNFNPTTAGVGVGVLTYTVSPSAGCVGSATRQVTVRARPTVSAGSNTQLCAGQSIALTGAGPSGGVWSGTGVVGNIFNATVSGVGTQVITYTFTDVNGCANSAVRQIDVLNLPTVLAGADQAVCLNGGLLTLQDGVPTGGIWQGTGVSNGRFDPSVLGVGTFAVSYTFVNPQGCSNMATKNVVVRSAPTVNAGSDRTFCLNSDVLILSGATPSGGSWSGPGISGTTFTPSTAGIGNHVITYTFTNAQGCSGSAARQFLVQPSPVVTAGSNIAVCSSETSVNLTGGNPFGGIWTGTAVNGSSFNAKLVGAGVSTVLYTFTNANGCATTATKEIVVNAGPVVVAGPNIEACSGGDPIVLTGASPSGGVWSGNGIVGAEFRPRNVSLGSQQLTYTFTNQNGCSNAGTRVITVNSLPNVNAGIDKNLCDNGARFDLTLDATPKGGTFSGLGVSNGAFNPSVVASGIFRVTYTFTDLSGCRATDDRDMTVIAGLPQPTITGQSTVCFGETGTFNATSTGANTFTSYKWYLEGDNSPFTEGRTISLKVFENQTIYVDAINRDGCSSRARGEYGLFVQNIAGRLAATKTDAQTGDAIGFEFVGTPGSKYAWDFGDRFKSSLNKPFHYYYYPGSYDVKLDIETAQGCKKSFTEKNFVRVNGIPIDVVTADTTVSFTGAVSFYPSPVTTAFFVELELPREGAVDISLHSQLGSLLKVQTSKGVKGKNVIEVGAGELAEGMHLIHITAPNVNVWNKIVKR